MRSLGLGTALLLIGCGAAGAVVGARFRNIHRYDLMADILGLVPAANDGRPDSPAALRR